MVDPNGFRAYSVALEEVTGRVAGGDPAARCTVFTGIGLDLDLETFTIDRVSAAAAEGNLVGAIVPLEGAAVGGGWRERLKQMFGGSG